MTTAELAKREALRRLDAEKEQERQGITFNEWQQKYFDEMEVQKDDYEKKFQTWSKDAKRESTVHGEKFRVKPLKEFFGSVPLVNIDYNLVDKYKLYRAPKVQFVVCNRELGFLKFLLRCAARRGVLKSVPLIELQDESKLGQDRRSVTEDEYREIIKNMRKREQQRVVIAWWETAMRLREPFRVKWPMVDKIGLLKLPAHIVKEKSPRRVPISYELRVVLEELRDEQRRNKIGDITGLVFTRHDGRPIRNIRRALTVALERAKLEESGITPHSFRRACISRWTSLGVPRDFCMLFSGHRSSDVHDTYLQFSDAELVKQFKEKGLLLPPQQRRKAGGE
jgi:integrase